MRTSQEGKLLNRVRLINWHYFADETIEIKGNVLISGGNGAGKSTVLDAIQLVLTTNTRKFNTAANDKGKRTLKGYIRCKSGDEGEQYLRKNTVISNVALEFYDEKTKKYFVVGVHMTSDNEEVSVLSKWYIEEGTLEALSFKKENKPSSHREFLHNGNKIKYIEQRDMVKERLKRRLGNVDAKIFELIPKAMAFKPMNNVKEFINDFILSENNIDVKELGENIQILKELEGEIGEAKLKLNDLHNIVAKYEGVQEKEKELAINSLLLGRAKSEACKEDICILQEVIKEKNQFIVLGESEASELEEKIEKINDKIIMLSAELRGNESFIRVESLEAEIKILDKKISSEKNLIESLKNEVLKIQQFLNLVDENMEAKEYRELDSLKAPLIPTEKYRIFNNIKRQLEDLIECQRNSKFDNDTKVRELENKNETLRKRLDGLEKKKLEFPINTTKLKKAIEEEFINRGIDSGVYILAELLEINNLEWLNAVEGYFNKQKFNIIVEPKYYPIARDVYNKNKDTIHSVGLINTLKIPVNIEIEENSLAAVVTSNNKYAKAYSDYLLGRVICCTGVNEFENVKIGITKECMLYKGYVVKKINKQAYEVPFIGKFAYRTQILQIKEELKLLNIEKEEAKKLQNHFNEIVKHWKNIDLRNLEEAIQSPLNIEKYIRDKKKSEEELNKANKNNTYIDLQIEIEGDKKQKNELSIQRDEINRKTGSLQQEVIGCSDELSKKMEEREELTTQYDVIVEENYRYQIDADKKYIHNIKTKSANVIYQNFLPQKAKINNEIDNLINSEGGLNHLQEKYNIKYSQDFLRGIEGMVDYIQAADQLKSIEMEQLQSSAEKYKKNCEEMFRQDFLARMRNNMLAAKEEIKNLNKALQNIRYGGDRYKFTVSQAKGKESLCEMIMSENNIEGINLFSQLLENEFSQQMEELFDKITATDSTDKIVQEYSDYRRYFDFDIVIQKSNGKEQKFSKTFGEKSGGETQVPYYVAMAASFYQVYKRGNAIKLMLLDEAFEKMDDERIEPMLDFFRELGIQVIIATPPEKIKVIGAKMETNLAVIRKDNISCIRGCHECAKKI